MTDNIVKAVCISERKTVPGQLNIGETYYIKNMYQLLDEERYGEVYRDAECKEFVGRLLTKHFEY